MNKSQLVQNMLASINAKQGLDAILSPVEGKIKELRDFADTSYSKANTLRKEAEGLLLQADNADADAERAERIANNLEEAVR